MSIPAKALITGATGFIGSRLAEDLINRGWRVSCLLRPESRAGVLVKKPVNILRGPTDDRIRLESALKGQDYVFHLAARIRATTKDLYEKANHLFTRNLAQACLRANPGLKRFIYVSSVAAAGPSADGVIQNETMPCAPVSEYGRTKLRGESAVTSIWDRISATIIRPPNVFGPGQPETELLVRLIRTRIIPALKDRGKTTCFIYIDDLISGMLQAALNTKAAGKIYYMTDGHTYSWREVISTIQDCVLGNTLYIALPEIAINGAAWMADLLKGMKLMRTRFGRSTWESMKKRAWLFSSDKAVRELGFKPQYSLERGIRKMLASLDEDLRSGG